MSSQTLFDDFNYSSYSKLAKHGWIIRTAAGWPGVPGAIWGTRGVSFPADQDQHGNRLLRMISSTDGTGSNTYQTQICHQRKYLEGTYAARVRFVDLPTDGPSGDQLVESFSISSICRMAAGVALGLRCSRLPGGLSVRNPTGKRTTSLTPAVEASPAGIHS